MELQKFSSQIYRQIALGLDHRKQRIQPILNLLQVLVYVQLFNSCQLLFSLTRTQYNSLCCVYPDVVEHKTLVPSSYITAE